MHIYKKPKTLLGTQNAKTIKGEYLGYKTLILYLSPERQNSMGKNLCPKATKGCAEACLFTAGRGRFTNVYNARINKTEYFLRDRNSFMNDLVKEIEFSIKKYGEESICVRLNGTSDIPYENIPVDGYKNIFERFPSVQFYDYTKVFTRLTKQLPKNYHLTFSRAETKDNHNNVEKAIALGFNVSVVFAVKDETQLPETYLGRKVINGDIHDLLFMHEKNIIVGLKAKGKGKKDKSGFVLQVKNKELTLS